MELAVNHDLESAIQHALAPLTQKGTSELCPYCGVIKRSLDDHTCSTVSIDLPGMEGKDEKRRARSYCID